MNQTGCARLFSLLAAVTVEVKVPWESAAARDSMGTQSGRQPRVKDAWLWQVLKVSLPVEDLRSMRGMLSARSGGPEDRRDTD